jgi:hypothetical protein
VFEIRKTSINIKKENLIRFDCKILKTSPLVILKIRYTEEKKTTIFCIDLAEYNFEIKLIRNYRR